MKILSIETSCDDTAIAVIEFEQIHQETTCKILANFVSSQASLHNEYGGVFPAMAKREHIKNLPILYQQVVEKCGENFDAITVTVGPGLEPCLWTGITFAKELAERLNMPIIPVNHMEGHLFSSLLPEYEIGKEIILKSLPNDSISLLVSGGHTEIVKINKIGDYEIMGHTVDDAVGEAYDKVARMLGLPYPGGPHISKLAEISRGNVVSGRLAQPDEASRAKIQQDFMCADGNNIPLEISKPKFPRPMIHSKDYNFSFSGLKTAVLYYIRDNPIKNEDDKMAIACAFEDAAVEVLIKKITTAINECGATHLLLGGGVSANKYLSSELNKISKENNFEIYEPLKELTGDNAVMIAIAGYFHQDEIMKSENIKANGNLKL